MAGLLHSLFGLGVGRIPPALFLDFVRIGRAVSGVGMAGAGVAWYCWIMAGRVVGCGRWVERQRATTTSFKNPVSRIAVV